MVAMLKHSFHIGRSTKNIMYVKVCTFLLCQHEWNAIAKNRSCPLRLCLYVVWTTNEIQYHVSVQTNPQWRNVYTLHNTSRWPWTLATFYTSSYILIIMYKHSQRLTFCRLAWCSICGLVVLWRCRQVIRVERHRREVRWRWDFKRWRQS